MSPKWISFVLKYFSLFGIHSIASAKFGGKTFCFLIFLNQIFISVYSSFGKAKVYEIINSLLGTLDVLNILLYDISNILTFWLIVYDSYTKKNAQNGFWHIFRQINQQHNVDKCFVKWSFIIALVVLFILSSAHVIVTVIFNDIPDFGNMQVYVYFQLTFFFDHRMLFYYFHLNAIAYQLEKIQVELREMQKKMMNSDARHELSLKLRRIRKSYSLVSTMARHMNSIFGYSHLALVLHIYLSAVTVLNSIHHQYDRKFGKLNYGWDFSLNFANKYS